MSFRLSLQDNDSNTKGGAAVIAVPPFFAGFLSFFLMLSLNYHTALRLYCRKLLPSGSCAAL